MAMPPFPEPTEPADSRTDVFLRYLDYYREVILEKTLTLSPEDQRASILPSGWTPLELVVHLTNVERRWLVWGFEGRDVDDPWADWRDGRWYAAPEASAETVTEELRAAGRRTREIALRHALDEIGVPGERWDGAPPATLERVLLHLTQEYARHAGHLDIVREPVDGTTGE